jgi:hypothetical protein
VKAISAATHDRIKGFLEGFIENIVLEYKGREMPLFKSPSECLALDDKDGRLKPFHYAMLPQEIMRINEFERGFVTRLGNSFEECARLIALEHHQDARRGYKLTGEISSAAVSEIESQVSLFEHVHRSKGPKPSFEHMVSSVLDAQGGDLATLEAQADLYILTNQGEELYFEIKSPKPNKGQCLEVTQRLLRFHLLRGKSRPAVQAYYAMAYNPWGTSRSEYRHSYVLNYMPFEQAVLIGNEFWNIVGGPTTYEELLSIYQEVGNEKGKYMIDALAFGF